MLLMVVPPMAPGVEPGVGIELGVGAVVLAGGGDGAGAVPADGGAAFDAAVAVVAGFARPDCIEADPPHPVIEIRTDAKTPPARAIGGTTRISRF